MLLSCRPHPVIPNPIRPQLLVRNELEGLLPVPCTILHRPAELWQVLMSGLVQELLRNGLEAEGAEMVWRGSSCHLYHWETLSRRRVDVYALLLRLSSGETVFCAGCSGPTFQTRDEILNGKTLDKNSNYFAKYCFERGIEL